MNIHLNQKKKHSTRVYMPLIKLTIDIIVVRKLRKKKKKSIFTKKLKLSELEKANVDSAVIFFASSLKIRDMEK